ncbi:hypothetical protein [Romboutsia ilealis]|uniref:hypothetical protein n=1 Tax=Romboutsia ilealis TaxID=1115758 RepID=UPI002729D1A9|nr:hypothetical protein [Romboutsia ilealis]
MKKQILKKLNNERLALKGYIENTNQAIKTVNKISDLENEIFEKVEEMRSLRDFMFSVDKVSRGKEIDKLIKPELLDAFPREINADVEYKSPKEIVLQNLNNEKQRLISQLEKIQYSIDLITKISNCEKDIFRSISEIKLIKEKLINVDILSTDEINGLTSSNILDLENSVRLGRISDHSGNIEYVKSNEKVLPYTDDTITFVPISSDNSENDLSDRRYTESEVIEEIIDTIDAKVALDESLDEAVEEIESEQEEKIDIAEAWIEQFQKNKKDYHESEQEEETDMVEVIAKSVAEAISDYNKEYNRLVPIKEYKIPRIGVLKPIRRTNNEAIYVKKHK